MANFGETIKNALQSDVGQSATSGALGAFDAWLNPDDEDSAPASSSITDQPWFLPAVVLGGLALVYVLTKRG